MNGGVRARAYYELYDEGPLAYLVPYTQLLGSGIDNSPTLHSETKLYLTTGGNVAKRVVVDTNGYLGVRTSSPGRLFEALGLANTVVANSTAPLADAPGTNYVGIGLGSRVSDGLYRVFLHAVKTTSEISSYWNTALTFSVTKTNTYTDIAEVMRITSDERVAVGTSTPQAKLHLAAGTLDGLIIENSSGIPWALILRRSGQTDVKLYNDAGQFHVDRPIVV